MTDKSDLKRTPLYENHVKRKARIVPFAGYEMPVQYAGVLEETKAVRTHIGLFDVSHMGQFRLKGSTALDALQKLVTNDLTKIQIGQAQYNMLCLESGGVIDDIIVYRKGPSEVFICVNASNRDADRRWMIDHLPKDVHFQDESDDTALIAVQGPKTEEFLSTLGNADQIRSMKYYWADDATLAGTKCYLSRTGYTGEDGFEIYLSNEKADAMWDLLLDKGQKYQTQPIGLGARDTLRLEMGYPLHGHELSQQITPISAQLNWVVKFDKGDFIGKAALQKEKAEGSRRVLSAFVINDRRIARQDYKILNRDKQPIGIVTSGTHSPHLNKPIALGFIDSQFKNEKDFFVEVRDSAIPAQKVSLPFIPASVKKNAK